MSALLPGDDPIAVAATEAVQTGDLDGLVAILDARSDLVSARIGDPTVSRTLLHAATDWPGNFPNVDKVIRLLISRGADVDARFVGGHTETPLHWAASSNDVAAIEALLDGGADIEADGAVLGGGSAIADACGFGNWDAAHRLVERGARTRLKDAAALGLIDRVKAAFAAPQLPDQDDITRAFWSACHGDQLEAAAFLAERGADVNWVGWDGMTALDVALRDAGRDLVDWLRSHGARSAADPERRDAG